MKMEKLISISIRMDDTTQNRVQDLLLMSITRRTESNKNLVIRWKVKTSEAEIS